MPVVKFESNQAVRKGSILTDKGENSFYIVVEGYTKESGYNFFLVNLETGNALIERQTKNLNEVIYLYEGLKLTNCNKIIVCHDEKIG